MNIAKAKCIPIGAYLERQGLTPQTSRMGGRELWYNSPIRSDDNNPSIKNLWFDHRAVTDGNIIDLVREICSCDARDALQHLDRSGLYSPGLASPVVSAGVARSATRRSDTALGSKNLKGEKQKTGAFELVASRPLQHPALL